MLRVQSDMASSLNQNPSFKVPEIVRHLIQRTLKRGPWFRELGTWIGTPETPKPHNEGLYP